MNQNPKDALEFPSEFSIRAIGREGEDFQTLVFSLVQRHVPDLEPEALRQRPSGKGNYVSITVTIQAESREQLDAIYRDLNAHRQILMTL